MGIPKRVIIAFHISIFLGDVNLSAEGHIVSEPQYICDVCGKKKPVSQMAGKCVKCGKYVCSQCAVLKDDKVYCPEHGKGCFIATAAYGTPMAKEINILRAFRDEKLELTHLGRQLVIFYYRTSPSLAEAISYSERMRATVRYVLYPIIETLKRKS
jgi:hypothetical protein